ncbi:hypothetical protein ACWKSP_23765 [Micromonosporaceae bacterium Da 78-11]
MTIYRSTTAGLAGPAVEAPARHPDLAAADHWILALDPAPTLACTHLVRTPYPHVVVSTSGPTPDRFGRAVVFPGSALLVGTLSVAEVLALSAIDRVDVLGGGPAEAEMRLDTGGFVRPHYAGESLVLVTTPAVGGVLVPFERPHPTPCCAAH